MTENNCVAERARGDILGMPVISIQDGLVLGRIRQLLIDGKTYQVQGFLVEKRYGSKEDRILPFPAVASFGTDSITIERPSLLERKGASHQYIRALRRPLAIIGSRVFTTDGKTLGKVEEYRFSTESGTITALELSSGLFREHLLVSGAHIIAISPQTVMLKSEAAAEAAAMENALLANMENAAETVRSRAAAFYSSTADATKKLTGGLSEAVSRLRSRDSVGPANDIAYENENGAEIPPPPSAAKPAGESGDEESSSPAPSCAADGTTDSRATSDGESAKDELTEDELAQETSSQTTRSQTASSQTTSTQETTPREASQPDLSAAGKECSDETAVQAGEVVFTATSLLADKGSKVEQPQQPIERK